MTGILTMKKLLTHINHKFIQTAFLLFAVAVLAGQSVGTAFAVTALDTGRKVAIQNELDRRATVIANDKQLVTDAGSGSTDAFVVMLDSVKHDIDAQKQALGNATTNDQLNDVAASVDTDYDEFHAVDMASRLFADLKSQDKYVQQLKDLAAQVQAVIDAAKANGATHINAGVGGFIAINIVNDNIKKLKKSLTANAIITVALSSTVALLTNDNQIVENSSSSSVSILFDQLTSVQDSLSNVALGLSQLSNLVTGNRTGVSYCGYASNCNGMENNGVISVCGIASSCKDSTNNGIIQSCGIASNCTNSTNSGANQSCGILSNCTNSTNNGVSQTCGIASNCQNTTNNGVIQSCGAFSNCATSTNNGVFVNCGIASNCSGSTNNGVIQVCGVVSNCQNATNNGVSLTCGVGSICKDSTNNGVAVVCGLVSNCSGAVNNGGVINCGIGSNCTGTTNNGQLLICGVASNCKGSTNNGFVSICGLASDCSNSTTSSFLTICGTASNCSNNNNKQCLNSDGLPVTSASVEVPALPLRAYGTV